MTTVANIATQLHNESGYSTSEISLANTEYLIDKAIDYINLEAGTSIADLAGAADSKSITGTENQIVVVKMLAELLIRARLDKGPEAALPGVSVPATLSDPQYDLYSKLVIQGINRLRGTGFERT